jgi:hypothetical protein
MTEPEVTPTVPSASLPIISQAEVQTTSVQMAQLVQTLQVTVPEKVDVETQTVHLSDDNTMFCVVTDSILYGGAFAPGMIGVYANIQRRGWQKS